MYTLIRERVATMTELKEKYNLDERFGACA